MEHHMGVFAVQFPFVSFIHISKLSEDHSTHFASKTLKYVTTQFAAQPILRLAGRLQNRPAQFNLRAAVT